MVRTCHFHGQRPGSIPGMGTNIPTNSIVQPKKQRKGETDKDKYRMISLICGI